MRVPGPRRRAPGAESPAGPARLRTPLYNRVLFLRHLQPRGWQRALFVEGSLVVAVVLALADLASAWILVALPLAVAVAVKFHDLVSGALSRDVPPDEGPPVDQPGR